MVGEKTVLLRKERIVEIGGKDYKIIEPVAAKLDLYLEMGLKIANIASDKIIEFRKFMKKLAESDSETDEEEIKKMRAKMQKDAADILGTSKVNDKKTIEFILNQEIPEDTWNEEFTFTIKKSIVEIFEEISGVTEMEKNFNLLLPQMM